MYGMKNRGDLPPSVVKELDSFFATQRSWTGAEHNDDGTHIPKAQRWTLGPWVLGGPEAFDDTVYVRFREPLASGTYNNYAPPGLDTAVVINIDCAGNVTLTGLQAPSDLSTRQVLLIRNEGNANNLVLNHEDTNSTDVNRFRLPNNTTVTMNPNESVWLFRDTKHQRWVVLGMVR